MPILLLLLLLMPAWARADGPVPPCEEAVLPSPGPAGAPPVVRVWQQGELPAGWVPPACSGWTSRGFRLMAAISGRLGPAAAAALPARLEAISRLAGIRFWAVSAQQWQVLIREAHALTDTRPRQKRADFSDGELTPGRLLRYSESDNGSGEDRYRMQVLVRTPDRLEVETENAGTIRFLFLPLFHPGDVQALYVLDRQADGSALFYSLTRIGMGASSLAAGHAASLVNRAMAMYRYLAGIPTDQEPPAAR